MAAMTGRKLRLKDCSTRQQLFGTQYTSGSVVCWPISALPTEVGVTRAEADTFALEQLEDVGGDDKTEEARPSPGRAERVLAVLQVHCADGVLSAAAVEALHGLGRLLVPLLTEALARDEEYVRRRSTEALLSLSNISPRDVGLIAMVEEVVHAAQRMTEAERVCLFFVDDAEHKLWMATSVGFDDPKIKIGEGLCGYAAATGGTVNVIDSCKDPRFDGRWDKQTGFVTKGVLCVPIPPPAYAAASGASRAAAGGNGGGRRWAGQQDMNGRDGSSSSSIARTTTPSPNDDDAEARSAASVVDDFRLRNRQQQQQQQQPERDPLPSFPTSSRRGSAASAAGRAAARPLAVLQLSNKRGRGVFNEHDENALVSLCGRIELLLRDKAAETALLLLGMTERSLVRESNSRGGAGGAWSNYARVQSAIMQLYSGATFPTDAVATGRGSVARRYRRSASDSLIVVDTDVGQTGVERDGTGGGRDRRKTVAVSAENGVASGGSGGSGGAGEGSSSSGSDGIGGGGGGDSGRVLREENPAAAAAAAAAAQEETTHADSELVDLSMNLFDLSSQQLLSLVGRFFRDMELTDRFQIPDKKMWSFLRAVERRHPPNAFHNLTHAVSVTHASFTIVKTSRADSLLRPLDKLGLLVAAFCHDIDHPGNNNAYEVNSVSPLALQYGDSSVLERHHVFVTYQVLLEEGGANNIFSGLTRIQFRDVRHTIVQAILGTDMSDHMQHCADVFQFALKARRLAADGGEGQDGLQRFPQKNSRAGGGGGGVGADRAAKSHTRPKAAASCETSGFPEGTEGARGEGVVLLALAPVPPSVLPSPRPEHVFSVNKAEDRSFLTKTILH
ncbi:unnamed protein product, partial [Ectocarpus sp. 13 AM-2016]